jgi:hypothetical protein
MTVLDAIIQSLSRAGEHNRDDQVAPAVTLWPDKERQYNSQSVEWLNAMPEVQARLRQGYGGAGRSGGGVRRRDDAGLRRCSGQAPGSGARDALPKVRGGVAERFWVGFGFPKL